jgi:hypothetical protein
LESGLKIVNKSEYETKEIKRLIRIVLSRLKKSFTLPDMTTTAIIVESYDSARFEGHYDGNAEIKVRLGRKVTYPNTWDRMVTLPTWEDCFVAMLTWCVCLRYQKDSWAKKQASERKVKYSRTDCQEMTVRMVNRWRVDSEMKMIFEKAGI